MPASSSDNKRKSTHKIIRRKSSYRDQDFIDLVKKWVNDDISYDILKKEYKNREEKSLKNIIFELINR